MLEDRLLQTVGALTLKAFEDIDSLTVDGLMKFSNYIILDYLMFSIAVNVFCIFILSAFNFFYFCYYLLPFGRN